MVNIIGSSAKDDTIVLGGREFKRARNGLDETEVASFIDELISERDRLAKSEDHIASLNRLAEANIVEADKLAAQIKTEAAEQAKAESAAIIDEAREQARQMSEKKMAEAVELANEKAGAIKAKAEEEAALLVENEKNRIRNELHSLVNQQFGYMLEELENLKRQAAAVQVDFGTKLSELTEESSTVTTKTGEGRDAAAAEVPKGSDYVVPEASKKTPRDPSEPGRATDHVEKSHEPSELLQNEEQPELSKPQWEVEILPPFDVSKIMEVVSFLDQLPEVANTEMIVPQIDLPSILVFLHKPMNVIDVLQTIPAVTHVEEIIPETAASNGRPRKVRISLSGNRRS
jgi:hypothetical protein